MVVGSFTTEIDVVVIGAGPGGYVAAIRAAQLGKKVTLIERAALGGVCLNRGCIPSKALIQASHRYTEAQHGAHIGIVAQEVSCDYKRVQAWKQSIVAKQTSGIGTLLSGNRIEVLHGEAFFNEPNVLTVSMEEQATRLRFQHAIVATGSTPIQIKAFPFGGRILSSDEALALDVLPESLVVIGGGYIGVELGQMFARFGTKVTMLEGAQTILPGFDRSCTQLVARKMKEQGITLVTEAQAVSHEMHEDSVSVVYRASGKEHTVTAQYVLVTVGRKPNTEDLGLESIGVQRSDRGLITIDAHCRTTLPHIYAIGDIVEGPALAHKASYEAKVAAEHLAGHDVVLDARAIPAIVFSEPELASVGLGEAEAQAQGHQVVTGRFSFAANGRAQALDAAEGFVKMIASTEGIVLGAHIVGPSASELIAQVTLAIEMGATVEDIILTVHAHPTLSEVVLEASEAVLGRSVHQLTKVGK
jgi:dihydrolipoamide dehydrogenase